MRCRVLVACMFFCSCFAWASLSFAQNTTKTPPAQADTAPPASATPKAPDQKSHKLPVVVEHDDADPLGTRLAYQLKELLGRSALMTPTNKDEKKLVIVLKTREEFPARPNLCAIYGISWLFSARDGSLRYFLSSEVGIVDTGNISQTAEIILSKTDKLATRYGYLF